MNVIHTRIMFPQEGLPTLKAINGNRNNLHLASAEWYVTLGKALRKISPSLTNPFIKISLVTTKMREHLTKVSCRCLQNSGRAYAYSVSEIPLLLVTVSSLLTTLN